MQYSYQDTITDLFLSLKDKEEQTKVLKMFKQLKEKNNLFAFDSFLLSLCRDNFYYYVVLFFKLIVAENIDIGQHVNILSATLQEHSRNNLLYDNDLVINIPPGHSKTTICNVLYSTWLLGREPDLRIIVRTASRKVAIDTQAQSSVLMRSCAYQQLFNVGIVKNTQSEISTTQGGYRITETYETNVSGQNADMVIIDDPNDVGSSGIADNLTCADVINRYTNAIATRNRGTSKSKQNLVIQQRVNMFDLSSYLIDRAKETEQPINLIVIRAEEQEATTIKIPCKDKVIEILRPAGFLWLPKDPAFRANRERMYKNAKYNTFLWHSQYQQQPEANENCILNYNNFKFYDCEVKDLPIFTSFITTDLAYVNKASADRTCLCSWGLDLEGNIYLLDIIFDRLASETIPEVIWNFYQKNSRYEINDTVNALKKKNIYCYRFFIEENQNAFLYSLYFKTKQKIANLEILQRKSNTTKEIRLMQATPLFAQGIVYLPDKRFFKEKQMIREEFQQITAETFNTKKAHDDFCFVAGSKVKTIKGDVEIQNIKVGDKVITPFGIREVECCECTGEKEVIYNKELDLIGTPNHKVICKGKGFCYLKDAVIENCWRFDNKDDTCYYSLFEILGIQDRKDMISFSKCCECKIKQLPIIEKRGKQQVWNLKVKGGCYFVNNILVSNCDNLLDAINEGRNMNFLKYVKYLNV